MDEDADASLGSLLRNVRPDASALAAHETKARLLARFGATASPSALERYTIEKRLGRGGWGVVYAAYDDKLQRRVAIKVLHETFPRGSTTLLREARAMARLSHRNVVAVHDVGEADGQLFIVMDLVEGQSLARWLKSQRMQWMTIVEPFIEAGRGLQCAHEAGLVHRDFKAANVLVGTDGRVQVTDFGLAAPLAELKDSNTAAGTVGYQAPEVVAGESVAPTADQYSFCAALREALTLARGGRPPRWLDHAIHRGLSPRAADRWPSMKVLLDTLVRRKRRAHNRRRGAAVAVVSAGLVAGVWVAVASARPSACEQTAADTSSSVEQRAAAIEAAFTRAASSRGREQWQAQRPALQELARGLGEGGKALCAADANTHEELHRRRQMCIEQRSWELQSLLDVFASADATVVDHASDAVALLHGAQDCEDPSDIVPLPSPQQYADTLPARRQLALAINLEHAGQYDHALRTAEAALASATTANYPPLMAEAGYRRAMQLLSVGRHHDAREGLIASLRAAQEGRHDLYVAWSQLLLASTDGFHLGDAAAGQAWAEAAEASAHRIGDDPSVLGALAGVRSAIALNAGDYSSALAHAERALELRLHALADDHPYVAGAWLQLGNVHYRAQNYDAAATAYGNALAMRQSTLGHEHPQTGIAHNNVALPLMAVGNNSDARAHLQRALSIAESTAGDAVAIRRVRFNLLQIEIFDGNFEDARAGLQALRTEPARSLEDAGLRRKIERSLAGIAIEQARYDDAAALLRSSAEDLPDDDHPQRRALRYTQGTLALAQGDAELAHEHFSAALDLAHRAFDEHSAAVLGARVQRAAANIERGREDEARTELRALRPLARTGSDAPLDLALVDQLLGRVLIHEGRPAAALAPLELALRHHGDAPWDRRSRGETLLWWVDAAIGSGDHGPAVAKRLLEAEEALGPSRPRHAPKLAALAAALQDGV